MKRLASLMLVGLCIVGLIYYSSSSKLSTETARYSSSPTSYTYTYRPTARTTPRPTPKATATPSAQHSYVLNTNTKKFHIPTCSSVGQMADKNKKYYTGARSEVIAMGYVPCKRCNP